MGITEIKVVGYDIEKKQYKFVIKIGDNDYKLSLKWDKVKKSFNKIGKQLNKDIHQKLLYDIQSKMIIKDKNYMTAKDFLNGKKLRKNKRKINDIQNFFNFI